jgi:PPOX class probable F420-dependent enzyme
VAASDHEQTLTFGVQTVKDYIPDGIAKYRSVTANANMAKGETMDPTTESTPFDNKKYLNLETYRINGQPVRTPVWFAVAPDATLYVYTTADSGKAKRLRRSNAAKIAPCNASGKATGPWIPARATIVDDTEAATGMRLLNRKYRPWKQIMDIAVRLFPRHRRIVIAIRPTPTRPD